MVFADNYQFSENLIMVWKICNLSVYLKHLHFKVYFEREHQVNHIFLFRIFNYLSTSPLIEITF